MQKTLTSQFRFVAASKSSSAWLEHLFMHDFTITANAQSGDLMQSTNFLI